MQSPPDTTQLLLAAGGGSEEARDRLFELLYDELRVAAHRQLRKHAGRALDTTELATLSQRTARVVELRFFGGMTEAEVAAALEVSVRTVSGEWRKARAWLTKELGFS